MQQQRGAKGGKLTPVLAASYRLAPDGVLERRVHLASEVLWAPCVPDTPMDTTERTNWRRWPFTYYRSSALLHLYRPFTEAHHLVRRAGYWGNRATGIDR
eukprot:14857361-Alexandrium_andersonii.AAC.1